MNKLEFKIERLVSNYIIECIEKEYYFFYDTDKEIFYDKSLNDIKVSALSTEEELFQSELINDQPLSIYVYYKILKLFKMRNMIFPNKKFTIEY